MSLRQRIQELNKAIGDCDGVAGRNALNAINREHGRDVATAITDQLIAGGLKNARTAAAAGDRDAQQILNRAAALGIRD